MYFKMRHYKEAYEEIDKQISDAIELLEKEKFTFLAYRDEDVYCSNSLDPINSYIETGTTKQIVMDVLEVLDIQPLKQYESLITADDDEGRHYEVYYKGNKINNVTKIVFDNRIEKECIKGDKRAYRRFNPSSNTKVD